jgi:lipoprotein-anchoring transpeptidase ErfK/SrfK
MIKNKPGRSLMLAKDVVAVLGATTIALLSGCASLYPHKALPTAVAEKPAPPKPVVDKPRVAKAHPLYEWNGDGHKISHIEISVDEQKARFYDGDREIGWTTVASGVRKHPTPVGRFAVLEKAVLKTSNIYGKIYDKRGKVVVRDAKLGRDPIPPGGRFEGAKMPFFLRLTGDGIAMHAGPIPRPGHRASHGCIRMPRAFASLLYRDITVGTSVSVEGNGPAYATYIAEERAAAAKLAAAKTRRAKPAAAPAPTVPPGETATVAKGADRAVTTAGSANGVTANGPTAAPTATSAQGAAPSGSPTTSAPGTSPPANAAATVQSPTPEQSAGTNAQSPAQAAPPAPPTSPSPPAMTLPQSPSSTVTGPPKHGLTPPSPAGGAAATSPRAADQPQSLPQREG